MTLTEYSIQSRSFIPKITFRLSILIRFVSFLSSYKQITGQETKRQRDKERFRNRNRPVFTQHRILL